MQDIFISEVCDQEIGSVNEQDDTAGNDRCSKEIAFSHIYDDGVDYFDADNTVDDCQKQRQEEVDPQLLQDGMIHHRAGSTDFI